MPRSPSVPSYRLHKPTGQAVVTIRTADGARRDVYLGRYNSPESRTEYARLIAELAAGPVLGPGAPAAPALTVDQLLLAFLKHAEQHYRTPDGKQTDEVREIKRSALHLHRLYGHTPAAQFGPRALAAVRQAMIGAGWCRTLINRRVERIKRAFRWAASQELVPVTAHQGLRTLPGLQKGRTEARESEPVVPVDPAHVRAALSFLGAHLRTVVELQLLTGMRPGEACGLTLAQVDRTGDVWHYAPDQHKGAHRGKPRVIPIGPRARALLEAFVTARGTEPDAPVFSPRAAQAERFAAARAARKSKVPPSQQNRRVERPARAAGDRYRVDAYGKAVAKACARAGVPPFHPNQLRHTFGTEVRRAYGLEAAQVLLGHSRADVTQIYAERNQALAEKIATEIG